MTRLDVAIWARPTADGRILFTSSDGHLMADKSPGSEFDLFVAELADLGWVIVAPDARFCSVCRRRHGREVVHPCE
jgi:hypothetical protein